MRFLGLIVFLFCFNVNAGELSAPQISVEKYFEYFNDKDKNALDAALDKPFIFNIAGKVTRWDNYHEAVDFDGLEKSGWSYSRILKNELIYADDITAMVDVTFSRFNISNEPILKSEVVYFLVQRNGVWKIKSGFINGNVSLGR